MLTTFIDTLRSVRYSTYATIPEASEPGQSYLLIAAPRLIRERTPAELVMAAYNTAVVHHDSLVAKTLCTAFASRGTRT